MASAFKRRIRNTSPAFSAFALPAWINNIYFGHQVNDALMHREILSLCSRLKGLRQKCYITDLTLFFSLINVNICSFGTFFRFVFNINQLLICTSFSWRRQVKFLKNNWANAKRIVKRQSSLVFQSMEVRSTKKVFVNPLGCWFI